MQFSTHQILYYLVPRCQFWEWACGLNKSINLNMTPGLQFAPKWQVLCDKALVWQHSLWKLGKWPVNRKMARWSGTTFEAGISVILSVSTSLPASVSNRNFHVLKYVNTPCLGKLKLCKDHYRPCLPVAFLCQGWHVLLDRLLKSAKCCKP